MVLRAYHPVGQIPAELVPPASWNADAVDVEHVAPFVLRDLRGHDARTGELLFVQVRELPPAGVPPFEASQLDAQDRRLDLVEPRVVANDRVVVARRLTVLAQSAELFGEPVVVGGDAPRLAVGSEVLRAVEGEAAHAAGGAGFGLPVVKKRAVRLRRVLDDRDVSVLGELAE